MVEQFEIVEKAIGPVVEIEERIPVWKMPKTFGRDFKRIANYLESHGAQCEGMPYARYTDMNWEKEINRGKLATFFSMIGKKWHFYAGMPSTKALSGEGELKSQTMPSHRYAKAVHHGPYRESVVTYKALLEWARSQGFVVQDEAIEFYANDPNEVDEAEIETVIFIPLQ